MKYYSLKNYIYKKLLMDLQFQIQQLTRQNILEAVKGYSLSQLNEIPPKFNNNLAWNIAHVMATQQLLLYGLSDLPMQLEPDFIAKYRKGSRPEKDIDQLEWDYIIDMYPKTILQAKEDYRNGIFSQFKSYTTSYGMTLTSIEESITFNNVHEGLHFGSVLAIRKLV